MTPGLDAAHATQAACIACHQELDPLRSIFSATFSWNYHAQDDSTFAAQKGMFAFAGVIKPVGSLTELGGTLAAHPLFAQAWVQKLCTYANSAPCATDDPEFQRIAAAFASSNFSWPTLTREMFSSPIY